MDKIIYTINRIWELGLSGRFYNINLNESISVRYDNGLCMVKYYSSTPNISYCFEVNIEYVNNTNDLYIMGLNWDAEIQSLEDIED